MEQNLQEFNHNQNLIEWSRRIEACRNSQMTVRAWCEANGISPSTYYERQRKVFAAAAEYEKEAKAQFVEVCVNEPKEQKMAACIRIGDAEADIFTGADEATVRAVVAALRSC